MIGSSTHLIGGDANVTVTVWVGAARVTDVVDAALVVCISGHFDSAASAAENSTAKGSI